MADFRKLLLVLIAGCLLFTTVASAVDYKCTASSVPTLIRAEGLAEMIGDVKLQCGGTPPMGGIQVNIRMTLSANITSNPLSATDKPTVSEATLVLDKGANGYIGYDSISSSTLTSDPHGTQNVYQAIKISDTEVEWQGVVLAAPGSAGVFTEVLLTNVRANAGGVANAPISATINITTPSSVTVDNNSLVVANTRAGMTFSMRNASGGSTGVPVGYQSCVSKGYSSTSGSCSAGFYGRFVEGFNNAFKPRVDNLAPSANHNPHNIPAGAYPDESGFNPENFGGSIAAGTLDLVSGSLVAVNSIGAANQGTRLVMRVKGVPSGVVLGVPLTITTDNGLVLTYAVVTASDFGSGYVATASSTFACAQPTAGIGDVVLDSSGNGVVVYEVTSYASGSAAPSLTDTVNVPFYMGYNKPGTPTAPTGITLSGSFAPISTVTTASASAPEPRFLDTGIDSTVVNIGLCRSILLFPYITNAAGFDTGIAISNTSADPLKTTPQSGTCTLNYYGNTNNATGPPAQLTPSISAGGQLIMLLSGGGSVYAKDGGALTACTAGTCQAIGFTGYMIAICNFQYAHGYAFISDLGAQKLAQGYLALIIPDYGTGTDSRLPQTGAWSVANQGEQLSQ